MDKVNSFHIQGIEYTRQYLSKNFYPGSKVRVYRIKKVPSGFPSTKWLSLRPNSPLPKGFTVDYEYYGKRLKKVMNSVLGLVNLRWENIDHRTLDTFLSN